jgi:D-3-phosphoglycerate dehydrogenase / 2-oxoglutarate reductase
VSRFTVVHVLNDGHPMPAWVNEQLAAAGVDLTVAPCASREDLVQHAAEADVVWAYAGKHLLASANLDVLKCCGAILRTGAGTDNIDVKHATELGIIVANTPHVLTDPVADQAISLLFSLVRQVTRHDRLIRRGQWDFRVALPGRRFLGATLGLVGFGRIPRLVARKLAGFEMQFVSFDPFVPADVMAGYGVRRVELDELLRVSDYVSVHCPLTPETYHLISERELQLCKRGALLINTARGAVIDEPALIHALQDGRLAGAGLDVFEQEPLPPTSPLLAMDNVILTPHYSGYSDRYPADNYEASVEALLDMAAGFWPRSYVNPGVQPRWGQLKVRPGRTLP